MKRTMVLSILAAMGLPGIMGGCATDDEAPKTGTLEMAVMAQGSSGTTYGLAATFMLNDPEGLSISSSELDPQMSLTLAPRVGSYDLAICEADIQDCDPASVWQLFELECEDPTMPEIELCLNDGLSVHANPVSDAVLVSANPQAISIQLNQTTTAVFEFVVPGDGTVVFARGSLNILAQVQEGLSDGAPCTDGVQCQSHVCGDDGAGGQVCLAPTCSDGVLNGGEQGADCGGPCPTLCPGTCLYDADCAPGEMCQEADPDAGVPGICVHSDGTGCLSDAECPAGEMCEGADPDNEVPGSCVPSDGTGCLTDAECPAGEMCEGADPDNEVEGTCVPASGSGAPCLLDGDCPDPAEICEGADLVQIIYGHCTLG